MGRGPLTAKTCALAISRGVALGLCAITLTASPLWLAERIEECGGALVHRRARVVDRCAAERQRATACQAAYRDGFD